MSRECDLTSIDGVYEWFRDPSHQISSDLYIVKWVGATPYISVGPGKNRLREMEEDRALAEVVLLEHHRRRLRPQPEDNEHPPEEA